MNLKSTSAASADAGNENPSRGVKAKSDAATELQGLFENQLKDIYWVENALVKALPKMLNNVSSFELLSAIENHLDETKEHVKRLEEVFDLIGLKVEAKKCEAMAGLLKEAEELLIFANSGVVRDAGIISAAQKIEHYEIAAYGTLCSFARTLGHTNVAALLQETLDEEKECDLGLTNIAEASINHEAAGEI
ncbi:MAG: ferritin-like domain-containing protein [Bacteroidia bacterium]